MEDWLRGSQWCRDEGSVATESPVLILILRTRLGPGSQSPLRVKFSLRAEGNRERRAGRGEAGTSRAGHTGRYTGLRTKK